MDIYKKEHSGYADTTKKSSKHTKLWLYKVIEKLEDKLLAMSIKLKEALEQSAEWKRLYEDAVKASRRGENVLLTSEETTKKILELRAKSYAPAIISDKLRYLGIEVTVKTVKDIVYSELSPEMELYYNKCKEEYKEAIRLNTDELKQSNIVEIQALIDSCYEDLEEVTEVKEKSELRKEIKELLKLRSDVTKNIDDYESIDAEEDELLNETMTESEEAFEKEFSLKQIPSVKIKAVGE